MESCKNISKEDMRGKAMCDRDRDPTGNSWEGNEWYDDSEVDAAMETLES
jgi:hypothetical protein